ncbi:MAG: helicase-associated domain-containing protein [Gemmataceae bacterium]
MPIQDTSYWSKLLKDTLERYREPLLRQVIAKLLKPRSQWPVNELIERCLGMVGNAAVIDRRLHDLDPEGRQVLAFIGHSQQPRWRLGNLVEAVVALGHLDGLHPILALLEAGLLYPVLPETVSSLGSFEEWLGQAGGKDLEVFAHSQVAARAIGENLGFPALTPVKVDKPAIHESDGVEWPLRLAVLWQQIVPSPLRRTQQGELFKRDLERLRQDNLLNSPPADSLAEAPDLPMLAIALAQIEGVLTNQDGELRAAQLPTYWQDGLLRALQSLFVGLFRLHDWSPLEGSIFGVENAGNPFPSAYLLALLLLARQPEEAWARPPDVEEWVLTHHPFWAGEGLRPSRRNPWMATFLLGLAHSLRLIQVTKDEEGLWVVRISPTGRWLLGLADAPSSNPAFPQTLFVQPNLEIVVYRQGLTPALIIRLTQFAGWKSLGSACTLQLDPDSVYRALEAGLTFDTIVQTLEQHGMRPTPTAVIEALRTWSNKRERITVYSSAALLEFASPHDLNEAVARGLPAIRLSERLALVAQDDAIEYKHFRLTGTRDYSLPPEKCVTIDADGVTLNVDLAKSDLLLETELPRFAERVERPAVDGRRIYQITPASIAAARETGMTLATLENWFQQRAGRFLTPAVRLFITGPEVPPATLNSRLVLEVATEEMANGLMEWPPTQVLIEERLGPQALAVNEENAQALLSKLKDLGQAVADQEADRAERPA